MSGHTWRKFKSGEYIPSSAVEAGTTASDSRNFVARINGECGKVNSDKGKFYNFWFRENGRQNEGEVLCTSDGYEAVWLSKKTGDSLPEGAVLAGYNKPDGDNYACRASGTAGKVNLKDGKLWSFWLQGEWNARSEGEVCVIRMTAKEKQKCTTEKELKEAARTRNLQALNDALVKAREFRGRYDSVETAAKAAERVRDEVQEEQRRREEAAARRARLEEELRRATQRKNLQLLEEAIQEARASPLAGELREIIAAAELCEQEVRLQEKSKAVKGFEALLREASVAGEAPVSDQLAGLAWCEDQQVVDIMDVLKLGPDGQDRIDQFILALRLRAQPAKKLRSVLCERQHEVLSDVEFPVEAAGAEPGKYVCGELVFGESSDSAKGLKLALGLSDSDVAELLRDGIAAIKNEVEATGTKDDQDNLRYILEGRGQQELVPEQVLKDIAKGSYHGGSLGKDDYDFGNRGKTLDDFMKMEQVKMSGLERHEVVAIRLYTTSSYPRFNNPLRFREPDSKHPWPASVYFLSEGLKKLRAVRAKKNANGESDFDKEMLLWRGMKDKVLKEEQMNASGTELAPMSTTPNRNVAIKYAASKHPLVMKFVTSGLTTGVSIQFLSVYPKEEEYLYPPLTSLKFTLETGKALRVNGKQWGVIRVAPTMS